MRKRFVGFPHHVTLSVMALAAQRAGDDDVGNNRAAPTSRGQAVGSQTGRGPAPPQGRTPGCRMEPLTCRASERRGPLAIWLRACQKAKRFR